MGTFISLNWGPQSGYFCFLVLYLTTFLLQRNQLLLKCLYHSALSWWLLFSISSDALPPSNIPSSKLESQKLWALLLALTAAKGVLVTIWQSCTGWGQLSFPSALKSGQFLFPLWRNFSFFVKFQAENPSQGLPKKLSYGKGMPCLWINQHWPDRVNRGKRRILSTDLSVTELNLY